MDLLDLDLGLDAEDTNSPGRKTRRSQANVTTTPKSVTRTPKSSAKGTVTEKASTKSESQTKKTPAQAPVEKEKETEHVVEEANVGASTSTSVAQDHRSRSPSLEKRSRNKTKKRFSPSPVPKKRKSLFVPTPAAATPTTPSTKKKVTRVTFSQAELTESIRNFETALSKTEPADYDIPKEWKSRKPSETVDNIIRELTANSSIETKDSPATNAKTSEKPSTSRKSAPSSSTKQPASGRKRMGDDAVATETSDDAEGRSRTFSRELGVDDEEPIQEEPVEVPKKKTNRRSQKVETQKPATEPPVEEEQPKTPKRKSALRRKSTDVFSKDEPSTSEPAEVVPEPVTPVQRLVGGGVKEKKPRRRTVAPEVSIEEPNEEVKEEVPVVPVPVVEEIKKETKTPAKSTPLPSSPAVFTPAPRSSGRVSKPSRLYNDETFNTDIIGRARVTEQNPVKEAQAQAKEATPEVVPEPVITKKRPTNVQTRAPATPKPVPVVNGVQQGYTPSQKVPLEDQVVDGMVIKLNEEVTGAVDTLLFKVCKDGVKKHEDIDPKVVKAKQRAKADYTRKMKSQSKKLDIQMKIKLPSSEELGKRKRQAPKSMDDMYWTPPPKGLKSKGETEERESMEREMTPVDNDDVLPASERRQQKARESISHLFDAEINATMKEARKYSVPFEKYIKPKVGRVAKQNNIKLMSTKRSSADPDDFYYHELLTDHVSPSNSNIENVEEELDVLGIEDTEIVSQDGAKALRTEALDIAEQIASILPRPMKHDGTPLTMEQIQTKAMEHVETRKTCLSATMDIVLKQFGHETAPATKGVEEQGCMWHTMTSAYAQNLKQVYTISDSYKEDAITWTHQFMIENLPTHLLGSYLSVLRYARRLNSSRFGYIISITDQLDTEWAQVTVLLKTFVHKKYTEPGAEVLSNTIPYRRMDSTVFLLVPPTLTSGDHPRHRQHHGRIFRWLQSIGHPDSETIGFNDEIEPSLSVAEYLSDVVIERICEKVREKNRERPHCNVVLVGYGASTYMVHRAVNLVEGVSAVVSIGFPVMTPFGRRGTADDEILLTYCPTLYIVGSRGQRFNNSAMTELRASMINNSGLVVVGYANDHLLVPTSLLVQLGISQTVVNRMIVEKILDFLNLDAVRLQPFGELVPVELNNIYDLDSSILKSDKALSGVAFSNTPSASSSAAPSPVGSSQRRATVTGAGDEAPRKKKDHSSHISGPPTPSPRSGDDYLAFQSMMTSSVATADDMPRRSSFGSTSRVVERGDFRDHRPSSSSSSSKPSSSRGPLDPASISLI